MTSAHHRVQGLNNDEVPADWPPLQASELAWLGKRWSELEGDARLVWHSPRPMSAAAIVESPNGRVFVKRHHRSVRTAALLLEEHAFIAHLAAAGLPVVQVLRDREGMTAIEHREWTYEIHGVGLGEDTYRDAVSWTPISDSGQAREAGRMLARLHQASASYSAPQRGTHMLVARDDLIRADNPVALIEHYIEAQAGLAQYLADRDWHSELQRHVLPLHAGLPARLRDEPRLWAHNDWHASNLLWQHEAGKPTVSTILDFGLASPTSALFDLATAIERNAVAWLEIAGPAPIARTDIALALLAGYREVLPLDARRVHLLADLLPVVHLDFALSEVDYFERATQSRANADVAWYTFLLDHAEWFTGTQGQAMLAALHSAA